MRKACYSALFALCLVAPVTALAELDPADSFDCGTPPYAAICESPLSPVFYTASAGQNDFTIPWAFEEDEDIVVLVTTDDIDADDEVTWTQKTLTTDYTVSGELGTSGTLHFVDGAGHCDANTSGCNAGTTVLIYRDDAIGRTDDFGATISSDALNRNFDRLTINAQELENIIHRQTLRLPITDHQKDTLLPPMTPDDVHHNLQVDTEADGFSWSAKSNDDFSCIKCEPGECSGGANDGSPCSGNTDCAGVCTSSLCVGGTDAGEACTTNADCPGQCDGGGFTNCDYLSVVNGVTTCSNGTCPDSCEGGGGGGGGCTTCGGDGVCLGGTNDGDACTNDVDCPDGGVCAFGTCSGGTGDGNACTDDADCPGGGTCEYQGCLNCKEFEATCQEGESPVWDASTQRFKCARVGVCTGGTNDGKPCTDPADCPGGSCTLPPDEVCFGGSGDGNACTDDADCPEGGTCRPETGICLGGDNDGNDCHDDADCPGGVCVDPGDTCGAGDCIDNGDTVCQGGVHDGEACATNSDCPAVHFHPGLCAIDSCPTCTGLCSTNADCTGGCGCDVDNICLGGPTDGDGCTDDTDCAGTCTDGECDGFDQTCSDNSDCGGVCAPRFTDETCQGGTADGDPCTNDADCPVPCVSGACAGGPNNAEACTTNADCPGSCDTRDGVGVIGPSSSTDNAAVRWNGTTGKFVKDGPVIINDAGSVRGVQTLTFQRPENPHFIKIGPPAFADFTIGGNYLLPNDNPFHQVQTTNADDDAELVLVAHGEDNVNNKLYWRPMTYPIVISTSGLSTDGQMHRFYFTEDVNCPAGLAGSEFHAGSAFTSTGVFTFKHGASTMGTVTCPSGGSPPIDCTASVAARTQFLAGEFLEVDWPATADDTGGTLSFTVACVKVL